MCRPPLALVATVCCLLGMQEARAEPARDLLAGFLRDVDTVDARFSQSLTDADGVLTEAAAGRFWLSRPGRFRWSYTAPYEREVVSDGQRVWIYDPELEQVTVREIGDSLGSTPAGLLAGSESALDNLNIIALDRDGTLEWVQVLPTDGQSEFAAVSLGFDQANLVELEFVDRLDQRTRIIFEELVLNEPVDEAQFIFQAPAGADIIGASTSEQQP